MLALVARAAHATPRALLNLLFPPRCVACRTAGDWFCAACRASITPIPPPVCEHCGRQIERLPCPICATHPPQIDGIRAFAFFENQLREAIHALKYDHRPEIAPALGALLDDFLGTLTWRVDALIAVPLHQERERARGYNQALLLARALGARRNLPVWQDGLLRVRATRPQVELNAVERRANVQAAFLANERVVGARIALIDDVCTTGATIEACSIALKQRGAKAVWGLALARPRFSG